MEVIKSDFLTLEIFKLYVDLLCIIAYYIVVIAIFGLMIGHTHSNVLG